MRNKKPTPPKEGNLPAAGPDEAAGEDSDFDLDELDGDAALHLDDEYWEALLPEDDYEPFPEYGDFWTD
jgi:hypothetical protein